MGLTCQTDCEFGMKKAAPPQRVDGVLALIIPAGWRVKPRSLGVSGETSSSSLSPNGSSPLRRVKCHDFSIFTLLSVQGEATVDSHSATMPSFPPEDLHGSRDSRLHLTSQQRCRPRLTMGTSMHDAKSAASRATTGTTSLRYTCCAGPDSLGHAKLKGTLCVNVGGIKEYRMPRRIAEGP
jgi:hypothetical protein